MAMPKNTRVKDPKAAEKWAQEGDVPKSEQIAEVARAAEPPTAPSTPADDVTLPAAEPASNVIPMTEEARVSGKDAKGSGGNRKGDQADADAGEDAAKSSRVRKTEHIGVKVVPGWYKFLDEYGAERGKSVAEVTRDIIEEWLGERDYFANRKRVSD